MSRSLGSPLRSGGPTRRSSDRLSAFGILLITLAVVLGTTGLVAALAPSGTPIAAGSVLPATTPAASTTHGDLLVGPGQNVTIQPTGSSPTYYQGGNITVEAGGILWVRGVQLSFVSFVANTGTAMSRLSHVYHFDDAGTVHLVGSNLTTDVQTINAYAKLNLTVTGVFTALDSSLSFPGWLYITGSSASVTLNATSVTMNPDVANLNEPLPILGDTFYAPIISVHNGGALNLFGSSIQNLYQDSLIPNGYPRPTPLYSSTGATSLPTGGLTESFVGPSDSANLTLDWSYPAASAIGGYVALAYSDANGPGTATYSNNTAANATLIYGGTDYALGVVEFINGTNPGTYLAPLSSSLLSAITAAGMLQYLNYTGGFGTPSGISLALTNVTGDIFPGFASEVTILQLTFQLNTSGPTYALDVSDPGSVLTAVDTAIGVNWAPVGGSLYTSVAPYPWQSLKLNFTNGAVGYLANLTTPYSLTGVYGSSAILSDASSNVYLYRWAQFSVSGTNGLVLAGAQVSAFSAYNVSQLNNQTTATLNDIATVNPAMWGYLEYWDGAHAAGGWGLSNGTGVASILLASNSISLATLPDGIFLGGYHIGVTVPGGTASHWFNWSVSPYPTGVAFGTAHYDQADIGPAQSFPSYSFTIRVASATGPGTNTLSLNAQYSTTVTVAYNGSALSTVTVYATPSGGGLPILIASSAQVPANSPYTLPWYSLSGKLTAGTSYTLTVSATAYGVTSATYTIPGTYTVAGATTPSKSFFEQTFLGLPMWIWIAIAAAIVAGIVLFLLLARRTAAGKLVECGECGNLIPEDATVCPKCGAEFEKDLIRCSRCASTIPADARYCPECAAQLLGKPGEAGEEAERQGYADFTEKYRAEAKRELGENFSESAFWDWWKRQPSYTPYSQWKLQQGQGTPRTGMTAPPAGAATTPEAARPPKRMASTGPPTATARPPPATRTETAETAAASGPSLSPCPNCGKEIPPEYLVCPFCGAVTQ